MAVIKKPKKLKQVKVKMKLSWKNIIIYAFLIIFTAFLFFGVTTPSGTNFDNAKTVPLSTLINEVKKGKITSINVYTNKIDAIGKSETLESFKETTADVYQLFNNAGVSLSKTSVVIKDDTNINNWLGILSSVLPIVLMVAFFWFIFRQARGAQDNIFSFGKSSAKLFSKDTPQVTFSDVAGVDEANQ